MKRRLSVIFAVLLLAVTVLPATAAYAATDDVTVGLSCSGTDTYADGETVLDGRPM